MVAERNDATFVPGLELRFFLSAVTLVLLTITAVQAPAVLAGSLAGERERGILQILLTTTVSIERLSRAACSASSPRSP